MDFDDQMQRYLGATDLGVVSPAILEAGQERLAVDFWLEKDRGRRFAMWADVHPRQCPRSRCRIQGRRRPERCARFHGHAGPRDRRLSQSRPETADLAFPFMLVGPRQDDIGLRRPDGLNPNRHDFHSGSDPAVPAPEVKPGIGKTVIPMSLPKKPPQAMGIESRGVAAATDRFDRLMEASRFKDACGLVRPLSRPAHGSKREGELVIAPLILMPDTENSRCQLMRGILAHAFIMGCNADTRPTGRGKDGYGVVVDSHNAYWNI